MSLLICRDMTWQESKDIAQQWVDNNLAEDLRDQVLQLVSFDTDRDSRFFYPDRTAKDHAQITTAIARQARKRKAKTVYATITAERYREWLNTQGLTDTAMKRSEYIESCHFIEPNVD